MSEIPAELITMPRLKLTVARNERMADQPIQHFQEIHDKLMAYLEGE